MWKKGKARFDEGVLYSDGTFYPVFGSSDSNFAVGEKQSICPLIESEPNFWFYYQVSSELTSSKYNFVAGCGGLEGEGFVAALEKDGSLFWYIFLTASECLEIESCSDSELYVSGSDGYFKNSFTIPFDSPELFTHTSTEF